MKKLSKRTKNLKSLITQSTYQVDEAIELVKKIGTAKFLESIEAHISLNIDPDNLVPSTLDPLGSKLILGELRKSSSVGLLG